MAQASCIAADLLYANVSSKPYIDQPSFLARTESFSYWVQGDLRYFSWLVCACMSICGSSPTKVGEGLHGADYR